ncbi:Mitochondrial zinc maintenance protein 1, mitochondrial [Sorochytrium milnesiophthora]
MLRTHKIVFGEDTRALVAARQKTREEFVKARALTDPQQIEERLKFAEQVREYLLKNIVQGVRREPSSGQRQSDDQVYELRIDKSRHELNDNARVKQPYTRPAKVTNPRCCGEFQ